MDAITVAFVAALFTLIVGLAGAGVAAWNVHRTAKTTREGRIEERRADAAFAASGTLPPEEVRVIDLDD